MQIIEEIDQPVQPTHSRPFTHEHRRIEADGGRAGRGIEVAFVNNMAAAALETTERQFLRLLSKAAEGDVVHWRRYRLVTPPDAPNDGLHGDLADLKRREPDVIVVTGAEPMTADLRDEPFWRPFVDLLDWADRRGLPVLLSCLASHAAVLHFDGIRRVPLAQKRFGVFDHVLATRSDLTGQGMRIQVAHSRWNEVGEDALVARGYQVLTHSPDAGVDMFVKERGGRFLFCQGHPEYEPETLLREYRRDVSRWLRGERDTFPDLPAGCLDGAATQAADAFRRDAETRRHEELAAVFPYARLVDGLDRGWALSAAGIVGRWLQHACTPARYVG